MEKSKQILLDNLSEKIRTRRIFLNISQEKLAEKCNLDRTYISLIERAKRNPTYLTLEKLCVGLEISLKNLLKD